MYATAQPYSYLNNNSFDDSFADYFFNDNQQPPAYIPPPPQHPPQPLYPPLEQQPPSSRRPLQHQPHHYIHHQPSNHWCCHIHQKSQHQPSHHSFYSHYHQSATRTMQLVYSLAHPTSLNRIHHIVLHFGHLICRILEQRLEQPCVEEGSVQSLKNVCHHLRLTVLNLYQLRWLSTETQSYFVKVKHQH